MNIYFLKYKILFNTSEHLFSHFIFSHFNFFKHFFPKLLFLYWDGSPLSYLNYLTILSFNEYHLHWKIIVYFPTDRQHNQSWKSDEQKIKYEKKCYLHKLNDIPNVKLEKICLNKIKT